jgi:hypothetical protein
MKSLGDLLEYQERWKAVEAAQEAKRRSASLLLRWRQFNAAFELGQAPGLLQPAASEIEVFERWAQLKRNAAISRPKA